MIAEALRDYVGWVDAPSQSRLGLRQDSELTRKTASITTERHGNTNPPDFAEAV